MAQIKVQSQPSEVVTNDPAVSKNPFYRYGKSSVSNLPTKTGDFSSNSPFNPDQSRLSKSKNSSSKDNQIKTKKMNVVSKKAAQYGA